MNIMFILDVPINMIGGSQKSIISCMNAVKESGGRVFLISPYNANVEEFIGSKNDLEKCIFYFSNRNKNILLYYINLVRIILKCLRSNKIDIINAQNPYSGLLIGFLKIFKLINKKVKCIFTDRGFLNSYPTRYKKLMKLSLKGLDGIICTTDVNLESWERFIDNMDCKVFCIYNVLNEDWYNLNFDYKKVDDKLNVGFCGRFEDYKRWDTVYKIISACDIENIEFYLILTYDNEVQKRKMEHFLYMINNIENRIVNIYISISEFKIKEIYKELDVFFLTSENESFGRTLIEAMLTYTIPYGTNSGGVPTVVGNKKNLFEVGDFNTCIKILNSLSKQSNEEITKEKKKFYMYANEKYSVDTYKSKLIDTYNTIYHEIGEN